MDMMYNAGAMPPIPKLVRNVNAHTDANATCFFHSDQRRGSFGSVGEGCGYKSMFDEDSSLVATIIVNPQVEVVGTSTYSVATTLYRPSDPNPLDS